MSPQSFSCFLALPKELQIQIWEYAFNDEDPEGKRGNLYNFYESSFHKQVFRSPHSAEKVCFKVDYWDTIVGTRVMRACRLSRLIGLQSWTRMAKKFRIPEHWPACYHWHPKHQKQMDLILRIFGALINELKGIIESN